MKVLVVPVVLTVLCALAAGAAQKPFFPSSPASDEDTLPQNPNVRPQVLPIPVLSRTEAQKRPAPSALNNEGSQPSPSAPDLHRVEPRQLSINEKSAAGTNKFSDEAAEGSYQTQSGYYQQPGTNWGWSGSTGGTIACTICAHNGYSYAQKCCSLGYSQCCNVGVTNYQYQGQQGFNNYHTNSQWSPSAWPYNAVGGGGYQQGYPAWNVLGFQNNRQKPGSCSRYSNNDGIGNGGAFNQNAGYYYTKRSVKDGEADGSSVVKRDAPVSSGSFGYNNYQSPGGYGYSGGNRGYSGGYSGGNTGGYSGGGYSGGNTGGYSGGGYSGGNTGGYSGGGYSGGGLHGGNGILPTTYRPGGFGSGYCYRDYECPGIQKCCSGYCSNPIAVIG